METLERAQKVLKALTRMAEKELIQQYIFWLGKTVGGPQRFLSVVGVGCYNDEDLQTFGNLLNLKVNRHHATPGIILRNMAKQTVHTACGPMPPPEMPHKIILVPLPSLLAAVGPLSVKKILKDWKGATFAGDVPYCIYTVWK